MSDFYAIRGLIQVNVYKFIFSHIVIGRKLYENFMSIYLLMFVVRYEN